MPVTHLAEGPGAAAKGSDSKAWKLCLAQGFPEAPEGVLEESSLPSCVASWKGSGSSLCVRSKELGCAFGKDQTRHWPCQRQEAKAQSSGGLPFSCSPGQGVEGMETFAKPSQIMRVPLLAVRMIAVAQWPRKEQVPLDRVTESGLCQ